LIAREGARKRFGPLQIVSESVLAAEKRLRQPVDDPLPDDMRIVSDYWAAHEN